MLIYSYINTRENWKNSKLCENTPPCGRRASTQFLVFPISTRVDITVYQHGKCFIFLKYNMMTASAAAYRATVVTLVSFDQDVKVEKNLNKLLLINSHQLLCNSCSRLTRT